MPSRAIWSGSISFGLVNVPVKVVTATRSKDVKFNMLHAKDGGRIQQKRVCAVDNEEVPWEEIAKGYPLNGDEYVMITDEEMKALAPEKSDTIDIVDFVDLHEIDPILYEKTYYLVPQKGAAKAYRLLVEAMTRTSRVAVARVVMREKEHLVTLRPIGDALAMETMLYHDEVVPIAEIEEIPRDVKVGEKELAMAEQLVGALAGAFHPDKYRDEHRERVLKLIEAKAEGKTISAPPRKAEKAPADLVEALKASLAAAKQKAGA
jgi:DNA end-binding protein Ku